MRSLPTAAITLVSAFLLYACSPKASVRLTAAEGVDPGMRDIASLVYENHTGIRPSHWTAQVRDTVHNTWTTKTVPYSTNEYIYSVPAGDGIAGYPALKGVGSISVEYMDRKPFIRAGGVTSIGPEDLVHITLFFSDGRREVLTDGNLDGRLDLVEAYAPGKPSLIESVPPRLGNAPKWEQAKRYALERLGTR
ncbi:hypothetical protein JXB02_06600 [Candidatus Woesearchaeota archaeon]|nr:hypothetical protein [Candidatus Woesearchaeota archaeon]